MSFRHSTRPFRFRSAPIRRCASDDSEPPRGVHNPSKGSSTALPGSGSRTRPTARLIGNWCRVVNRTRRESGAWTAQRSERKRQTWRSRSAAGRPKNSESGVPRANSSFSGRYGSPPCVLGATQTRGRGSIADRAHQQNLSRRERSRIRASGGGKLSTLTSIDATAEMKAGTKQTLTPTSWRPSSSTSSPRGCPTRQPRSVPDR